MPTQLTVFFLFVAVLALIGVAAWLVRRFASSRLGSNANRGRMPRLAVIDAAVVDGRRRLVLVRRDNIEHLLMIGGPTDIVVEQNIMRAAGPQREAVMPRGPVGAELPPRVAPLPDANWIEPAVELPEAPEPTLPDLPPRAARPSFAEEMRRAAPAAERRADPLAGIAPEPLVRSEPPSRPRGTHRSEPVMPRSEPALPREAALRSEREPIMPRSEREPMIPREMHREPMPPRPAAAIEPRPAPQRAERPAPAPAPVQSADQNLAEMAQRLEAALRRPAEPPAADRAPPVAPEVPVREVPVREAPVRPLRSASPEATEEHPAPQPAGPGPRISFENLEDEMASLLGRPKTPT